MPARFYTSHKQGRLIGYNRRTACCSSLWVWDPPFCTTTVWVGPKPWCHSQLSAKICIHTRGRSIEDVWRRVAAQKIAKASEYAACGA